MLISNLHVDDDSMRFQFQALLFVAVSNRITRDGILDDNPLGDVAEYKAITYSGQRYHIIKSNVNMCSKVDSFSTYPMAPLTYTTVLNKGCDAAGSHKAIGYDTADCQAGTRPSCSGDKYKCYNSEGLGYYNWQWERCWTETKAQAEAICEKYRNGLATANIRNGGTITFSPCTAVGKDGGGYEPKTCTGTSFINSNGMTLYMVNNNGANGFTGYQNPVTYLTPFPGRTGLRVASRAG